ncbi:YsnF/AvaK domain-containing protein [Methylobacterium soli]|uniref:DUF2382 domain-containing protein n=1 Tax=Methylobacterium soli TaxID=553447 RepID=A0A6L3SZ45_9HYPH|nr:YsnF/AvaK domain-containing protein [Methylobacterium soli]KAB1075443.1 DUF2382 domain-containing protein [Methylobacterium soli]GJE43281.1 hypothetical protein AEGHOMDF_2460 [Methylobacterium soli]
MTTIRQLILASPAKANELFTVLADTSNNAVKTRERILGDLKSELEILAKLEEEHLFPVLRRHKETKDLVTAALSDNKQTRKLLSELEQTPKGSEEFAPKVAELRKVFQQSVRDERKELLPAVVQGLSDEEAQAVVAKIEDRKAEVEEAKRVEAEQRRAEQRQEREQAERLLAEQKEAADRERETEEAARKTAEQVARAAEIAAESSHKITQSAAETVQRVATTSSSTGSLFFDAMFGMWGVPSSRSSTRSGDASSSRRQVSTQEEEVIPLAEETLIVGKHTVNSGTTTVRRYVVEVPTEQQVTLFDEKVVVERRRPITDKASGETLTELTIEMVETSEVPLVAKGVKVREEVVVRRERTKRVETVRDTIRRDEVEISNVGERSSNKRAALAYGRK